MNEQAPGTHVVQCEGEMDALFLNQFFQDQGLRNWTAVVISPEGHTAAEVLRTTPVYSQLLDLRVQIEEVVCSEGEDAGVILLSYEGSTHREWINGTAYSVYDHEFFSPLGDKMIQIHRAVRQLLEHFPAESDPHATGGYLAEVKDILENVDEPQPMIERIADWITDANLTTRQAESLWKKVTQENPNVQG